MRRVAKQGGWKSWWRRMTLMDVLIFTVPPMCVALYLLGSACLDYHRSTQFSDFWSARASVKRFGLLRRREPSVLRRGSRLFGSTDSGGSVRFERCSTCWQWVRVYVGVS